MIALLGLVITALMIRVTRADLAGAQQAMAAAPSAAATEPVRASS